MCHYDLDDMDIFWLQALNEDLAEMGCEPIDENLIERQKSWNVNDMKI